MSVTVGINCWLNLFVEACVNLEEKDVGLLEFRQISQTSMEDDVV